MSFLMRAGSWAISHGLGGPTASAATLAYRLKGGARRRFSIDQDGDWINAQPDVTFASPTPNTRTYQSIHDETIDYFEYNYQPRPGDIVVDVGAGMGSEAAVFSRQVGTAGQVIAIEAHPGTFRALTKTVALSRLDNVVTLQVAVTDRSGTVMIDDQSDDFIGNSIMLQRNQGVTVPATTLDQIVSDQGLTRIDLLKMNIEGAEKLAIRGMAQSVALVRNIAVHCHDFLATSDMDEMRTVAEVGAYFTANGFDVERRIDDPRPWVRDTILGRRR